MNFNDFFPENEKPLDHLPADGGFCNIFRTFACVGDSLSSGEFQIPKEDKWGFYDMFEYSWGQYMARTLGSKVYNFSRGGMSAKRYMDTFGEENGFWNPELKCQAYIVALGVNDVFNSHQEIGSVADLTNDWRDHAETFAGYYGALVQRYREIAPGAKFFFVAPPRDPVCDPAGKGKEITEFLYDLAEKFSDSYVIDLYHYAPVYDEAFRDKFFLHGHMNPMGYSLTAKMMMSYIDYIIRHNHKDFDHLGFLPH